MLARHRLVHEALRLRGWAAGILLPGDVHAATPPAPAASASAWRLFLGLEACAAPLRSALRAGAGALPGAAARLLEEAALREEQRGLSALAQLRRIGEAARTAGWRVAVLKGGVALADGTLVDVHDLDVLASAPDAAALVGWLDGLGYLTPGGDVGAHYPVRYLAGSVPVEVHHAVHDLPATEPLLARAAPLTGVPGVRRLAPEDHLWHVLVHIVVQHQHRVLRLRDLLVLRAAGAACPGTALADVHRRMAASADAAELEEARGLASGGEASPRYLRRVGRRYLLFARLPRPGFDRERVQRLARLTATGSLPRILRQDLTRLGVPPPTGVGRRVVRACYRAAPALGRLAHRTCRLALYAAYAPPAALIALEERWLAWQTRGRA